MEIAYAELAAKTPSIVIEEPKPAEAQEIASMYQDALGTGGIYRAGCDQYPDPDLFSKVGIESIINSKERQLIVAKKEGIILGAAIIDWLDDYHCEINCAATRRNKRGLGIASALFSTAKNWLDKHELAINTTEFVTHSLDSQIAYMKDERAKFVGFSFCHYPHVFFPDHPESVAWLSILHGTSLDKITKDRTVFIPEQYKGLTKKILDQFSDYGLAYKIDCGPANFAEKDLNSANTPGGQLTIDRKGSYRYCHLNFPANYSVNVPEIDTVISELIAADKKFIFARIVNNNPASIAVAEYLIFKGFVFHSILPLYSTQETKAGVVFNDVLGMQWIHPDVLAKNAWPGNTDSVIKIYGYPTNITGDILSLIRDPNKSIVS